MTYILDKVLVTIGTFYRGRDSHINLTLITLYAEIISMSPFINTEIKFISLSSK